MRPVGKDMEETEKAASKISGRFSELSGSDVGIKTRCRLLFEPAAEEMPEETDTAETASEE